MNTPIYDFLEKYIHSNTTRLHMPGHKGNGTGVLGDIHRYDITEITGADELFDAEGIIDQSECNTAALYGAKLTSFSAGGSTACILTMLRLSANEGDTIIAARNVHGSFVNGCALLGLNPVFIAPDSSDILSGMVTADQISQAITTHPHATAVYITTPDYLGRMSDVAAIADVCKRANIPLVVDNAHGAHLRFLPKNLHPIAQGATLCCDSAHKTLPVLTGGSYLHVSHSSPLIKSDVKAAMSIFASTSPSYLILMSLDLNNRYLADNATADFARLAITMQGLCDFAAAHGFHVVSDRRESTKLTLDTYAIGMTGKQFKAVLAAHNIEPEYVGSRHVVLMVSPCNTDEDISRLYRAIESVTPAPPITDGTPPYVLPECACSVRKAMMSPSQLAEPQIGMVAAEVRIKCPPGVPVIIPGERLDATTIELLQRSGFSKLRVINDTKLETTLM